MAQFLSQPPAKTGTRLSPGAGDPDVVMPLHFALHMLRFHQMPRPGGTFLTLNGIYRRDKALFLKGQSGII
jgi:hypothetical protein